MIPVILSGGSGTRLWPVSREAYPKQFCEFYDQSFLKNTVERVRPLGVPLVLTVQAMKSLTDRMLTEAGLSSQDVIYEPMGKSTAPAVALACHLMLRKGKADEVIGIFPADHLVTDKEAFLRAVRLADQVAQRGEIVTLGIVPRYPSTGYGYIEVTEEAVAQEGALRAHLVHGFREKPNHAKAQEFINSGRHYWNAGMFIFRVSTMVEKLKKYLPQVWEKVSAIDPDLSNAKYNYALVESVSLDYGIMEKLERQVCVPCEIGWSDVGSWDELARLSEEMPSLRLDSKAKVHTEDSQSNFVFSLREKLVGLIGVQNVVVVDTPDALLICKKGHSEKVKNLVQQIKQAGLPEAVEHRFEMRPWGGFEILSDSAEFKVKRIHVDPGAQLSYQSHSQRNEHWIVIQGEARVTLNDVGHTLKAGESTYVPKKSKHRLANCGKESLVVVEVQTGSYFGEDDIVRYQDDYDRV